MRIAFLLLPRQLAGQRMVLVMLQFTRRLPQVLWLAAYLCMLVVWHDLTQTLHTHAAPHSLPASRRTAALRIQLSVVLCLLCVLLPVLPLTTMAAFNMQYPASAEAVDAIIACSFIILSLSALLLAVQVARALRYLVRHPAADPAAQGGHPEARPAPKWPLPKPSVVHYPVYIHSQVGGGGMPASPDFLSLREQATQRSLGRGTHPTPKPAHAYLQRTQSHSISMFKCNHIGTRPAAPMRRVSS